MSNSHKQTVSTPSLAGQTKTLFCESPGRAADLIVDGEPKPMDFKDAHAALDWCEQNRAVFYYLPVGESLKAKC